MSRDRNRSNSLPAAAASRHPTLDDIAAAVGMSPSTVSRAMSGSPLVREATRVRILKAARELGFEPDRIASSLSKGSSPFVGMIVPNTGDVFYARVLKGARRELEKVGFQVLLMESDHDADQERDALRTLTAHRVAGVLLATSGGYEPGRVPIVFFDHTLPMTDAGAVASANAAGMTMLVEHLVWHAHDRISYIGEAGPSAADERYDGFLAATGRRGVEVPADYVRRHEEGWSPDYGERAVRELLALPEPPTAIVASTDWFAIGALRALRAAGKRVPQDVAIVCFDDPLFSDLIDPPLTVIAYDAGELGARSARLLLEQLRSPSPPVEIRLPVELIVRRSCGCGDDVTAPAAAP